MIKAKEINQFLLLDRKCKEDGLSIEITTNNVNTYYFLLCKGDQKYVREQFFCEFMKKVLSFIEGYNAKMNTIILPYAKTSISSKVLAKTLGCKRIAIRRSTYSHPSGRKVINWGSQRLYQGIPDADYINHPSSIKLASNKINTLKTLTEAGVPTLGYTTERDVAQEALDNMDTNAIYVRHKLSSNSGRGIELIKYGEQVPEAPLYTYDLYKWTEWRLHVGLVHQDPKVIRIQQKVKRGMTKRDSGTDAVRNHGADYVFRVKDLNVPDQSAMIAVGGDALKALGLHFGALDIAHTASGWKVIEANTAAGLAGETTKLAYKQYFEEVV